MPFFDLGNIYIDSQYFTKDGLVLSGRIAWADIVELQGLLDYLQIEKMYVGFDGLIKEFKLKESGGSFGTFLASDWYISNNKYSLQINQTKDKDGNLSPVEILLSFDDCKMFPPKASTVDAIPVKNLKYRLKGNSMGFVYDDVILPEGTKIDFAKAFEKKHYNPEDTIRVSAKEVAEISNMLDQECVDLQRKKLFKLSEEYEYDDKGKITKAYPDKDSKITDNSSNEKYEYYDGLLWSKLYKNGNTGNIQFYSYDNNNRLIKITSKHLRMDKWNNFKENGTGTPQYFKYNEYGELVVEKNYNSIKMYTYEHYPDGKLKSKRVYSYNVPNPDVYD